MNRYCSVYADETGGKYFRAKDKEGLQNIYRQIDQLEKSKIEVTSYKRHLELFLPFMLAALGISLPGNSAKVYRIKKISLITVLNLSLPIVLFSIIRF